jgi:beta-lactamase class A
MNRLLLCLFACASVSVSASTDPLHQRISHVGALFTEQAQLDTIFASSFLQSVPAPQLLAGLRQLGSGLGSYRSHILTKQKSPFEASAKLVMSKGSSIPIDISIEGKPPHRIIGLFLRPPVKDAQSLADIVSSFAALPGTSSFLITDVSSGKTIAAHNDTIRLPLGSAFKLYILGELTRQVQQGKRKWSDVVSLDSSRFSLPSGILQKWPHGSPITLHTGATQMISISDNTATDLLLHSVGRRNVEDAMAVMGHTDPAVNSPFLSTRELFILKFSKGASLANRYMELSYPRRQEFLETTIASVPTDSVAMEGNPVLVDKLEWFASAREMAACMKWFYGNASTTAGATALDILAVNAGVNVDEAAFPYVGYKGGSEPGVIAMVYLLKHRSGKWYTLSASWMNTTAPVQEGSFIGLVQAAIDQLDQR